MREGGIKLLFEKFSYYMENGFKVVMHRDKSAKVITVGVLINYGSMNETNSDNGIAHFIEHILTSDNNDSGLMSKLMERMRESGAIFNAQTDKENTAYYIYGMSDNIALYLKLLSVLVFQHQDFSNISLDNEKKVVERELVGYYSSFGQISGRAMQALYSDASVGRITVGKRDNIRNFTREDVINKINDVYVPENAAIVIYGDFEYDYAIELIKSNFGWIKDVPVKKIIEPVQMSPGYFFNPNFNGESTVLSLCYRKITSDNTGKIGNSVELLLKVMLDPTLFQRLGYKLRIEKGLSYNIGGFGSLTGQFLAFGVNAVFNSTNINEVFNIMMESLNEIRQEGITEEELEKAKRNVITNRIYNHTAVKEQSLKLIQKAFRSSEYSPDNEIRVIQHLNLDEVNSVFNDLLSSENMGIACIGNCDFDSVMEKFTR